jgi:hypothetical protein
MSLPHDVRSEWLLGRFQTQLGSAMNRTCRAVLVLVGYCFIVVGCSADDLSSLLNVNPLNVTYALNPGSPAYSGTATVEPRALYDLRYKLTGVSLSDISISTRGPDLGAVSGIVKIDGVVLFTYNGDWIVFNSPQSLLSSPFVTRNMAGVNELIKTVVDRRPVVLTVSGTVGKAPAEPKANSVTVFASVQAYGHP